MYSAQNILTPRFEELNNHEQNCEFPKPKPAKYKKFIFTQFGEPSAKDSYIDKESQNWKKTSYKVLFIGTAIIGAVCLGLILGSLSGAIAGAIIVSSVCLASYIIYKSKLRHTKLQEHTTVQSPSHAVHCSSSHEKPSLELGKYYTTNVRIINDVAESFAWKKELIKSAKKSIELTPNFAGGEPFREILTLIKQKMEEETELQVHLIVSNDLLEKEDIELLKELSKIPRFHYLITKRQYKLFPILRSEENHVKTLIIDGKYFMTGGTGIHPKMIRETLETPNVPESKKLADKVLDKAFRDTDIIGEGEITSLIREQFFRLYQIWEKRTHNQLYPSRFFEIEGEKGNCEVFHKQEGLFSQIRLKYLVSGPESRKRNPITLEISKRILKTRKTIRIANLLFNPAKEIKDSLKEAKINGVKTKAYLNGTEDSISHYIYALPNRYNYNLVSTVYEYNSPNQLYHKKVLTFDDSHTLIGTYNLGIKSALHDYEAVVVIKDKDVTNLVTESLRVDKTRSEKKKGSELEVNFFSRIGSKAAIFFLGPFFG